MLVVDAATLRVLEINPAAEALFGVQGDGLPQAARELLSKSAQAGRGAEIRTRLAPSLASTQVDLSVTPFRVTPTATDVSPALRLLLRARSANVDGTGPAGCAVAVTDSSGRVLAANSALRALCRADVDPIEGRSLVDALGDPQRHLASLLADVRRDGLVHRASVVLGGGRAPTSACTVDAALMNDGEQEGIGFTFMPLEQAPADTARDALLALLDQGGDVPLPELMQRVAELAERHAVEAALRRAADDRSDPAAMLGVSDADLAERMRRLGLVR